MLILIARRLLVVIPLLVAVTFLVYALVELFPGDACEVKHEKHATPEILAGCRAEYNLDGPFLSRYVTFLGNALQGDLGKSIFKEERVSDVILSKLPATIELSLLALLIAFLLGTWIGTKSALKPGSWVDALGQVVSMAGVSIPVFWLGMMVLSLFAGRGDWFQVDGWDGQTLGPDVDYATRFYFFESLFRLEFGAFATAVKYITLPAITLATIPLATITRMTRSSVLEEAGKDYVTTARAKGLSEKQVIRRHVRRNALIPVVTITGLQLGVLLSGAVLTEKVFSWPGLGRAMVGAATQRDYPIIMGCMLLFVCIFVVVNLIVDLLYLWIDPRIRSGEA